MTFKSPFILYVSTSVCGLFLLSGCATTALYADEVKAFSDATVGAKQLYDQSLAARTGNPVQPDWLTSLDESPFRLSPACRPNQIDNPKACRIVSTSPIANACAHLYPNVDEDVVDPAPAPETSTVFKELSAYGAALSGIVKADDKEAFVKAGNAAFDQCDALVELADAKDSINCAIPKAADNVLTRIGTAILEKQRYEVLKEATKSTNAALQSARDNLAQGLADTQGGYLTKMAKNLQADFQCTEEIRQISPEAYANEYDEIRSAILTKTKALNTLKSVDSNALVSKFIDTHNALTKAVEKGDKVDATTLQALFSEIEGLQSDLKALQKALKEGSNAGASS